MNMQTIMTDNTLSFPKGLIGFEDQSQFNLYHEDKENPTVHWLQSVTDEDFSMSIVSPSALDIEYQIILSDEEQALLKLEHPEDATVALIIYKLADGSDVGIKALLKAPIIINTKEKLGMQKSMGVLDRIS